jgi:CheY-like chemotaxis protein
MSVYVSAKQRTERGRLGDMGADSPGELFIAELGRALHHLYDPGALRDSSLMPLFGLDPRADAVPVLQRILIDAIESLQPHDNAPPESQVWRLYYILYYRFTEQMLQREVAAELGLSIRQLRRQEKMALQILGDRLAASYGVGREGGRPAPVHPGPGAAPRTPSRERELDWLERTIPSEPVDVGELIAAALKTARPLLETLSISLRCVVPEDLPPLTVRRTTLQQALLHVLTVAARAVPRGGIEIAARSLSCPACVRISVTTSRGEPSAARDVDDPGLPGADPLEMAEDLVGMSGGSLWVAQEEDAQRPFAASIIVPTAERLPVLVIDDNVDTLSLMQRYLSGSRYRFAGTSQPQDALQMAEQVQPLILVLDVMLPGIDGWELLGRLREHPRTRDMPVIVCSILPQDQLARALGAADYLPKPVSQRELLSALDRQVDQLVQRAHSAT